MGARDYIRIGTLVRTKRSLWQNPRQVVRVVYRRHRQPWTDYFVVPPNSPPGYGVWVEAGELMLLSPLELLAMQIEDKEGHAPT